MEAELKPLIQLMYFIELRSLDGTVQYNASLGLRNVGEMLLKNPAVAADVLVDNFSGTANTMDAHPWWTRAPDEWQPIGLNRSKKFYTWSDSNAVIYPGTERCVVSELPFYTDHPAMGLRTARLEVFVYGERFHGCAVLELGEPECITMLQKSRMHPAEDCCIAGLADLEPLNLNRYAAAPVAGRASAPVTKPHSSLR